MWLVATGHNGCYGLGIMRAVTKSGLWFSISVEGGFEGDRSQERLLSGGWGEGQEKV